MEMILNWVKSGLLFGVFASVILMICPNKSYMKHVSMVVGLLFILVMLHPLMELSSVDASVYAGYIRNFLMLENGEAELTENERALYETSLATQLEAVFVGKGYPVERVVIRVRENGDVREVILNMGEEAVALSDIENYVKGLFGGDVRIIYE